MIELRALGTAEIRTDKATLTPSQDVVFAAALYLIVERGKPTSRARLASLLWPRTEEKVRAHRLRQTLHQLKTLGFPAIADRDRIEFAGEQTLVDFEQLELTKEDSLVGRRSFEFLPGYTPRASEALSDWLDGKRGQIHGRITSALLKALQAARRRGDWQSVESIADDCMVLDRYNETAVLARAEALAMRGGKKKAMSVLDSYIADLGESPSDLRLPAALLRKRVGERISDRPGYRDAEPAFVGREKELELLTERFERARRGHGSAVLLVGDPGIGKSRLCAEIGKFAELQGSHVQRVSCRRTHVDQPLSLFVDLVPALRELPGALGCNPETFVSLKRVTEFEKPVTLASSAQDSETLFENVKAALFDLFDSVVEERSLVLLIDDTQWLDAVSAKLLLRMVAWCETKRLWFLLNSRPMGNLLSESSIETITLSPLALPASTALLHSMSMPIDPGMEAGFKSWCLAVAEGNPFFLQELAHHWVETGHTYDVPPSIARILDERMSRLSTDALQTLQTSAVLGDHASVERIERILEFQSHRFLTAIEELSRAAMLSIPGKGVDLDASQLQPRHDLISSAAIGRLAPISLAFLHRRAADVIENESPHDNIPTTLLWACANHRHHAGDRERALTLSVTCAEHLLDLGLSGDAAAAFQKSLEYCVSDEERLRVLPRFAFALRLAGRWDECKASLRTCIALSNKLNPVIGAHNEFEISLLDAEHQTSLDFATLLNQAVHCVESSDAAPGHRVRAAVVALKIATDFGPGELLDSIYRHVAPLVDDPTVRESDKLEVQVIYRTVRTTDPVSVEELDRFAEVTKNTAGELAHFHALITAANACRISGRFGQGLHYVERASDHAVAQKLLNRQRLVALSSVRIHISASAFDEADVSLEQARMHAPPTGDQVSETEIPFLDARIALEKADLKRARKSFEAIRGMLSDYSVGRRAYYYSLGTQLRVRCGASPEEVAAVLRPLQELHPRIRGIAGKDFETYSLFLGQCALGEHDSALQMLTEYVRNYRRSNWPLRKEIEVALMFGKQSGGEGAHSNRSHLVTQTAGPLR